MILGKARRGRNAVFVCCDGLGRDWVSAELTPTLHALAQRSLWCSDHRAVFPSVTRTSAASIATGCVTGRHGLHGNRMGLLEDGAIVVRDVGLPDFRNFMRRATGRTLHVPTLAERVRPVGEFIAFSNVSPGAAYFLDPDHFGRVYHRAGSYGPGGTALAGSAALAVSHDLDGDRDMTARFCREVLEERRPSIAFLWLANPDLTLHGAPLGSPPHLAALRETDRRVRDVTEVIERLRSRGEDILLLVGSDHGQETVGFSIDVQEWLTEQGLGALVKSKDIAVAGQGTAALLYATDRGRPALGGILDRLQQQRWVGELLVGQQLLTLGFAPQGGVVAAFSTARTKAPNIHGICGQRWTIAEPGKPDGIGNGQHGGWGPDETRPFLMINGPDVACGSLALPTSLVDIAPTILAFLGLPTDAMDGTPIGFNRTAGGHLGGTFHSRPNP